MVSGTDVERPLGQYRDKSAPTAANEPKPVVYGPSKAVDYELEFAAIIGKPLAMGKRLNAVDADEHIFGFVILNDWSGESPSKTILPSDTDGTRTQPVISRGLR